MMVDIPSHIHINFNNITLNHTHTNIPECMLQPNPVVRLRFVNLGGFWHQPTSDRSIQQFVRDIFQGDTAAAAVRFFLFLPSADMFWLGDIFRRAYCDVSLCGLVDHDKHLIRQHFFGWSWHLYHLGNRRHVIFMLDLRFWLVRSCEIYTILDLSALVLVVLVTCLAENAGSVPGGKGTCRI